MGFFSRLFQKQDTKSNVTERTLMNLRIGDMVSYNLEDYEVVGKINYNDHGFEWFEYQLESVTKTIWLNVEMDDELEASVYEMVKQKIKEPVPKSVDLNGITYTLEEHGNAFAKGEGRSVNINGMNVQYYDYSDKKEEHFLSVEFWGTDNEVSVGYAAESYDFEIIAGSK